MSRSCLGDVPVVFVVFLLRFAVLVVHRFCGGCSRIFLDVSRLCCGCVSAAYTVCLRVHTPGAHCVLALKHHVAPNV